MVFGKKTVKLVYYVNQTKNKFFMNLQDVG